MQILQDTIHIAYQINAYTKDSVTVNKEKLKHSFIVTPTKLINPWQPKLSEQPNNQNFDIIMQLKPDVIIIGANNPLAYLSKPALFSDIINQQIGVEIMEIGATCRTYNFLTNENRHISVGFIF